MCQKNYFRLYIWEIYIYIKIENSNEKYILTNIFIVYKYSMKSIQSF